jgi:ATP-dependent Lhr-like helicase
MVQAGLEGRDALLIAPTGGGKTLAGFLPSLIDLAQRPKPNTPPGVHTLYISPLKALTVDVHRNLTVPAQEMGLPVRIETRTGDTPVSKRARQKVSPPDILLTTPEQLALFCAWEGARDWFSDLKCVILDEIHAIHGSKRGDLLNLGLARLQSFAPNLRRTGLSATVNDPEMLRRWLSPQPGMADLILGDPGAPPVIDVLISNQTVPWSGWTARHAMAEVYEAIAKAKTTLVFVNTRFQAELAFQALWELNDRDLPIALHHGSLAAEQRRKVEAAMGRGELRAVVCTSTLDLGIDWGAVDLVIQLAAPKGSARLIQRIGRANHRLDEASHAILVPAHRFEMLECQAAAEAVAENDLDGDPERAGALDILAQHVMGAACGETIDADVLYAEVLTSAPYRDLPRSEFDRVVEFVSTGGYALATYDRFRRIVRAPASSQKPFPLDGGRVGMGVLAPTSIGSAQEAPPPPEPHPETAGIHPQPCPSPVEGEGFSTAGLWRVRNAETAQRHRMNIGAIVDIPMLAIRLGNGKRGGRKIGEMEESYIEQLAPGDTFLFAGQVWSFQGVTGLDAFVLPAPPGKEPKVPSWGGAKFALSTYLAARVRRMIADQAGWPRLPDDVRDWLEIQRRRSIIPAEDEMLVETFQRGSRHYLVCYPFDGRLCHGTLCQLLARRLERAGKQPLGFVANDYALALWAMKPLGDVDLDQLFQQDMLGDDLEAWLEESVMMKRAFRQCATLSGLIERRSPGREKSGRQVTFSTDLIYDVLRRHQPDHLLLACARTDAATGQLDVARLGRLLARIRGHIRPVALDRVSPFSVPVLLEIGREPVAGAAQEAILEENAESLIAEALEGM